MNKIVLLSFLCGLFFVEVQAQPGTLDKSFSGDGIQEMSVLKNMADETVHASVLQKDGKLLVVGVRKRDGEEGFVARLKIDGSFDEEFANKGFRLMGNVVAGFVPNAIALQANGRIVLAGYRMTGSNPQPCIVRLFESGALDVTFAGGQGYIEYTASSTTPPGSYFSGVHVHPQTDHLYLTGTKASTTPPLVNEDFLVCKVDDIGNLVQVQTFDLGSGFKDVASTSVLDGNRLYIAGTRTGAGISSFVIQAIDVSGTSFVPVAGFNNANGNRILPSYAFGYNDACTSIKVASDGKIVLGGYTSNGTEGLFMVQQLLTSGASDLAFSGDGLATYNMASGNNERAYTISLDPNDNIVLAGHVASGSGFRWALVRVSKKGVLDTSFGVRTYATTQSSNMSKGIASVLRLKTGKYVLVGDVISSGAARQDAMVKLLNNDGTADLSFGKNSEKLFSVSDASTVFTDMVVRSDGKIWACGTVQASPVIAQTQAFLALFNTNGSLDPSYTDTNPETEPGVRLLGNASFLNSTANALELLSDGSFLVGGSATLTATPTNLKDFLVISLDANGNLNTPFNGGLGYYTFNFLGKDDEVADIAIQNIGLPLSRKIILYGLASTSPVAPALPQRQLAMMRVNENGTFDNTFRLGHVSTPARTFMYASNYMDHLDIEVKVQEDNNKIVAVGGRTFYTFPDMAVFRFNENGDNDVTFDGDGVRNIQITSTKNEARSVLIKPDGKILVGGYAQIGTNKNYALVQLNTNGSYDTDFNYPNGYLFFDQGLSEESINGIHLESTGDIIATGYGGGLTSTNMIRVFRFYANGTVDNTFSNAGAAIITEGQTLASSVYNDKLYLAGSRDLRLSPYLGVLAKVKLGAGVPTITTTMVLNNVNARFGDVPFKLQAISNSPAPQTYKLVSGTCAEVDRQTGRVTITCAGPVNTVSIRAYQDAIPGYTADSVDAVISIAKATPQIQFKDQGVIIGESLVLDVSTNTESIPTFSQLNGASFIGLTSEGQVTGLTQGVSTVLVSYPASDNYLDFTAVAKVYAYTKAIAPKAVDDEVQLLFDFDQYKEIQVLANDTFYTGVVEPTTTDLDPTQPGIQDEFTSPSVGFFSVDASGLVRYFPFQGFIGSGEIYYTISDSRGSTSLPAKISVSVKAPTTVPALKATEMFTPNGDNLNEAFVIGFVDPQKSNRFIVFDRNGRELYSESNYKNDWTGKLSNGEQIDNGVYYYIFTEGEGDGQREIKGAIEIRQ